LVGTDGAADWYTIVVGDGTQTFTYSKRTHVFPPQITTLVEDLFKNTNFSPIKASAPELDLVRDVTTGLVGSTPADFPITPKRAVGTADLVQNVTAILELLYTNTKSKVEVPTYQLDPTTKTERITYVRKNEDMSVSISIIPTTGCIPIYCLTLQVKDQKYSYSNGAGHQRFSGPFLALLDAIFALVRPAASAPATTPTSDLTATAFIFQSFSKAPTTPWNTIVD
jgi:hypothetical protein